MRFTHKIDWNAVQNFEDFKRIFTANVEFYVDPLTMPEELKRFCIPMTVRDKFKCMKDADNAEALRKILEGAQGKSIGEGLTPEEISILKNAREIGRNSREDCMTDRKI